MQKNDAIDAICGHGFPSQEVAAAITKIGLARFTGNQWNECWDWDRSGLSALDSASINQIYRALKAYEKPAEVA